ncbi:MAG: ATP-dependent endonuclease [Kineosporiaceae bacterium]|nr:ATP-dependent endonuclease [Kineosporiaceae bacterium]MBK8078449.1 ATP-dependent endonuclease [Kineosporiaceae bacterium]
MLVQPLPAGITTVVLVEGDSDREAVAILARRSGLDLAARSVAVVAMGGATNVGHHVRRFGPGGLGLRVFGVCDEGEVGYFAAAFEHAGLPARPDDSTRAGGFHVCRRDLEDELIRALGIEAVMAFVADRGELAAFRILQRQPAQRHRSVEQHLHRFIGTRAGRKRDYGAGLAGVVPLDGVPAPLTAVLAQL